MFALKPSDWLIFTIRYKYIYPHRKRIYWQFPFDKMECTVQLLFEMQFVFFSSLKIHSKRNTINCYRRRYQFSAIIAIAWMYYASSYCNKWNKIPFELIKLRLDCKRKFTKKSMKIHEWRKKHHGKYRSYRWIHLQFPNLTHVERGNSENVISNFKNFISNFSWQW